MSALKPGLSVFVIAKDAAGVIGAAIESVRSAADEIVVVVDSADRDSTADAARAHTANVSVRPFDGFSSFKNHAMSLCTHRWAMNLDTDEIADGELCASLNEFKKQDGPPPHGARILRRPVFLGGEIRHCGWFPDWVTRVAWRESAHYPARAVHERLEPGGSIVDLRGSLRHTTADRYADFLEKQSRYAKLSAARPNLARALGEPPLEFLRTVILQSAWLDGWRGFAIAYAKAAYAWMKYRP